MKKDVASFLRTCFYLHRQHDAGEQKTKQNIENMKTYRTEKTMRAAMKRMGYKFATSCTAAEYRSQYYAQFIAARTLDSSDFFFFHAK